jgi:CBS domain-containing protein/PII-like signaling protein
MTPTSIVGVGVFYFSEDHRMSGEGKRVMIYIGETDKWHHQPAYMAILHLLRREGCAGATVERGIASFGASGRIKTAIFTDLVMELPIIVTWVDRADRVERVLPQLAEMVPAALITTEDVHVYQYSAALHEGLPEIQVEEIMTRDVATVTPETTLAQVVEKLLDKPYTALPVVDSAGRVVGIISDTDLLERGEMAVSLSLKKALEPEFARSLIAGLRHSTRVVAQVMTPAPVTIGPKVYLSEAARRMSKRSLKRLPVVTDDNHLVGVLSRVDILKALAAGYLPEANLSLPSGAKTESPHIVSEVMDRDAPTVSPQTLLSDVLAFLASTRVKRVVVVDADRHVKGIISDTDLIERMSPETHPGILEQLVSRLPLGTRSAEARSHLQKARGKTAADLMTHPVITLRAEESIATALVISAERHIKRFPVVDEEGKLIGIVGRGELLSALMGHLPEGESVDVEGNR